MRNSIINIITYTDNGIECQYRHYSRRKLTDTGAQRIVRRECSRHACVTSVETFVDAR